MGADAQIASAVVHFIAGGMINAIGRWRLHPSTNADDRKGDIASIPGYYYFGWAGVCIPDSIGQEYGRWF